MFIQEAIKAAMLHKPYITRTAWNRLSTTPGGGVKILPTDSPDGCIVVSDVKENRRHGWQPTAADLIADDWIITR